MRAKLLTAFSALILLAGTQSWSHPATEQYIPIGKSPGVSNVKSYIGAIRSVSPTDSGFTMSVEDADMQIKVDESTKIFLDTGPGKTNKVGTEEDCEVGRVVEVYLHDGVAYWIKIRTP